MVGQDNTLGAPTEGLGQNVTFAIGDAARTPQTSAGQQGQLRAAMSGGGEARVNNKQLPLPVMGENQIFKTLFRFGEEMLKPRLEKQRNEAFAGGMQRVASGTAIAEIVDEQPWYSKVFGDTPAIEGARAYAGFDQTQQIISGIEEQMPSLRELSPDSFKSMMAERLSSINTGDTDTNLVVAQNLIKETPGLMKRHTKEHIGWQQGKLASAQQSAQLTAGSRLERLMNKYDPTSNVDDMTVGDFGSTMDGADMLDAQLRFAKAFQPIPGVPEETHNKMSSAAIGQMLSKGNLHAFYALADSGVVDSLGSENAKRLYNQSDRIEARKRAEMPDALADDFANIKSMVALYDRKGVKEAMTGKIEKLNADYKALTGAREPLIAGRDRAELVSSLQTKQINAERSAKEAWAKSRDDANSAAVKAQEKGHSVALAISAMAEGRNMRAFPPQLQDTGWATLNALQGPQRGLLARARIAQSANGEVDKQGQGFIRTVARQSEIEDNPTAWHNLYVTEYLPLVQRGDETVALQYFGEDAGRKMSAYHGMNIGNDVNSQVGAFNLVTKVAQVTQVPRKDSPEAAILKEVASTLKNDKPSGGWFSSDSVPKAVAAEIAAMVTPSVLRYGAGDVAPRVAAAIRDRKAKGLEIVGGYYWEAKTGPKIADTLNRMGEGKSIIPVDQINDVIKDGIASAAKAQGVKEPRPVYHMGDDGVPILLVGGFDSNSTYRTFPVTLDSLHKKWVRDNVTVSKPKTGMPSPLAGQEAWRAYNNRK